MKKTILVLAVASLLTSCCMSQIPTQYVYVDEDCKAVLPNYTTIVNTSDNCGFVLVTQAPLPGDTILASTNVGITAIDESGNTSSLFFDVVLLDTIAPLIQYNPDWTGYSDQEVGDMYKVFYGWVQDMGDYWNENIAGLERVIDLPDTTFTYVEDSMKIFQLTIPVLEYRMADGYWSNTTPDLTALFK